jgi:hypothetical protein
VFDFNTVPEVFGAQKEYFDEGKRQFPAWNRWNIERNGTETLALHQILFLYARNRLDYKELLSEVLNMNGDREDEFAARLNTEPFDRIFLRLYQRIADIIAKLVAEVHPDVVGCSLFNSTWPSTLFILKRIKKLAPGIRTIVGGPGPMLGVTANADEVQSFVDAHEFIDYFVIGEGEKGFLQILNDPSLPRGILQGRLGNLGAIPLDELPCPNYGDLLVERYLQLSVSTSRGCPFECSFCAETVFWEKFRAGTHSKIFERVDSLARQWGRKQFYICDSLSNASITPLTRETARLGKEYLFDCYLRPDRICTDELRTKEWHDGGLFRARLGMESGSQRILDAMTKKTNPDTMAKSVHALSAQGIKTSTLWIICYPGETESEFKQTLDFIKDNRPAIFQADGWLFQYHRQGLAHAPQIDAAMGSRQRFSDRLNDLLAIRPYLVDKDLSQAERFDRLERFVMTMKLYEIPNPYCAYEWLAAERRWKALGRRNDGGIIGQLHLNG